MAFSAELDIGYDSKYVSEGRNNLPEGGIAWLSISQALNDSLSLGAAYGVGDSNEFDYDELNIGIEFGQQWGDFDTYVNYTRLEFIKGKEWDNELGVGASYNGINFIIPSIGLVYSTESKGSVIELGLGQGFDLGSQLNIEPYARVTFDNGYASDEFSGHNHTYFGVTINYTVTEKISIYTILEHNIAGNELRNNLGEDSDQTWMGVHLCMSL